LAEVAHALWGTPAPVVPTGRGLVDMVAGHYEAMLGFYGPTLGLRVARKHLGWYMDEAATGTALRQRILTERDPAAVLRLLAPALSDPERAAA
jgi:tRNA-dihydrouridine synthase B